MPGWFQLEAQACHDVPLCIPIFARLRRLFQTLCFSKVAKPDHALNRALACGLIDIDMRRLAVRYSIDTMLHVA